MPAGPTTRPWKILACVLALGLGLYGFVARGPFTDVKRLESFEMTWEIGEPRNQWPGEPYVLLNFVAYPDHYQGYYSAELAGYLRKSGRATVVAEFEIASDFGKVRAARAVRIGDFRFTREPVFSHTRFRGERDAPSPWTGR